MNLWRIRSLTLAIALLIPIGAMAQTSTAPATAAGPQLLKPAELDQLVAPIALYPDLLLSEVLMASAYPLEVVQAERWAEANKNLKGDQLKAGLDKQQWDASIKSLVTTPSVLEMMSTQLDWTQKLGDAVVAQQADVMDAIQRLRAKAQSNNKLTSTKEQTVTVEQVQGKQVIAIAPTQPDTVNVPYYDPSVVYGEWPYSDYPPYYFAAPPYLGAFIATGIAFGAGYALGAGVDIGTAASTGAGATSPLIHQASVQAPAPTGGSRGLTPARGRQSRRSSTAQFPRQRWPAGAQTRRRPSNLGERHRPSNRPAAGNRPSRGHHVAHHGGGRNRAGNRPAAGNRPSRGHHVAHHGGGRGGGGGLRAGGGMLLAACTAARMRGGRGGGRRSDIRLKHDIVLLGRLDNGLGFYRFSYNGGGKTYVGVMAQEVQQVMPQAVARGRTVT